MSLTLSRLDILQNQWAVIDEERLCILCESCFVAGGEPGVMGLCGSGQKLSERVPLL